MTINITARRWRNRNGNTYHTVEVQKDGSRVKHKTGYLYGYGSPWEQTAQDLLCALYGGPSDRGLWHWQSETGHTIVDEVIDVKRRRDL